MFGFQCTGHLYSLQNKIIYHIISMLYDVMCVAQDKISELSCQSHLIAIGGQDALHG